VNEIWAAEHFLALNFEGKVVPEIFGEKLVPEIFDVGAVPDIFGEKVVPQRVARNIFFFNCKHVKRAFVVFHKVILFAAVYQGNKKLNFRLHILSMMGRLV
jgi:hypothetical protein